MRKYMRNKVSIIVTAPKEVVRLQNMWKNNYLKPSKNKLNPIKVPNKRLNKKQSKKNKNWKKNKKNRMKVTKLKRSLKKLKKFQSKNPIKRVKRAMIVMIIVIMRMVTIVIIMRKSMKNNMKRFMRK